MPLHFVRLCLGMRNSTPASHGKSFILIKLSFPEQVNKLGKALEYLEFTRQLLYCQKKTLLATLAVSLLNPHVYLDTVIMLRTISGNYPGAGRYLFGLGASCSSVS